MSRINKKPKLETVSKNTLRFCLGSNQKANSENIKIRINAYENINCLFYLYSNNEPL